MNTTETATKGNTMNDSQLVSAYKACAAHMSDRMIEHVLIKSASYTNKDSELRRRALFSEYKRRTTALGYEQLWRKYCAAAGRP